MVNKVFLVSIGLVIIALVGVPAMAEPPASAGQPFDQIIAILNDLQTKVDSVLQGLNLLQTDVTTIISTTDNINDKLSSPGTGVKMLTRTKTVKFIPGTPKPPSAFYKMVEVYIPDGKAADFRVQVATVGDWTDESGDILAVGQGWGYGGDHRTTTTPIYIWDWQLDEDFLWETEFTGNYMSIYVQFGDTLAKEVEVDYTYTVTTESGATIEETITDPPL